MKFEFILVLIFYWCNCHSIAHATKCEDATYDIIDTYKIRKVFRSEWGLIGLAHRFLYRGSSSEFYGFDTEELQKLCACVFTKINSKYAKNGDFSNQISTRLGEYLFHIGDTFLGLFPLRVDPAQIPCVECVYGEDSIALIKSRRKKAFTQPQWDIYVLKMDKDVGKDFQGMIIRNVDMKSELYITKKNEEDLKSESGQRSTRLRILKSSNANSKHTF